MKGILDKMKTILALQARFSSVLATQKYGERLQRKKPENQSILGSRIYGENQRVAEGIRDGKKSSDKD